MPDAAKPPVLLAQELLAGLGPVLESAYEVHRLWEHPDRAAFLAGPGARIRAIVAAGEGRLEPELLGAMPELGLIACVSVGYDGIDVDWCRAQGLAVTHSPGLNAGDVADHAVGSVIAAWRGIVEGDRLLRSGGWTAASRGPLRPSLKGKRAGIVGLGAIGAAVAERLPAFGIEVAWWGPRPKPDVSLPRAETLLDLARTSDLLFVTLRADRSNAGLIDKAVIEAVGPRGLICNVSRGSAVDQEALVAALKHGRLGMAALDVFDEEPTDPAAWTNVPNVVLTPHTAGSTFDSIPAMVGMTLENLRRFFAGEPLASPVS